LGIFLFGIITLISIYSFYQFGKNHFLLVPLIIGIPALFLFPQTILFLFIGSFYWGHHLYNNNDYFFLDWSHLAFLLLLSSSLSLLLTNKRFQLNYSRLIFNSLFLFFISVIISFLINCSIHKVSDNLVSLSYLANFMLLIIGFLLFSMHFFKSRIDQIINAVIILSIFEMPVVIYQILNLQDLQGLSTIHSLQNVIGTFGGHHSMLANMMTFPLGFSAYKSMNANTIKKRCFFGVLACVFLYAIIYSGSRSNLIGVFGAVLIIFLLKLKLKPIYLISLLFLPVCAYLLFHFSPLHNLLNNSIHSEETSKLDVSTIGRLLIWKNAWHFYWNSSIVCKLFGVGIANFMKIEFPEIILGSKFAGGAHDIFLHVLVETGLIGFVLFIAFYLIIIFKLHKQGRHDNLALAYLFITLSLLLSGITQETLWFQPVFGCLWLYYICLLSLILEKEPAAELPIKGRQID